MEYERLHTLIERLQLGAGGGSRLALVGNTVVLVGCPVEDALRLLIPRQDVDQLLLKT